MLSAFVFREVVLRDRTTGFWSEIENRATKIFHFTVSVLVNLEAHCTEHVRVAFHDFRETN